MAGARDDDVDGLRAVAALAVFMYHLSIFGMRGRSPVIVDVFLHGNVGVWIFFVISGFLLYRPFAAAHAGAPAVALGRYSVRRALRIYPAYWVAFAIVPWLLMPHVRVHGVAALAQHLALVQTYFADVRVFGVAVGLSQSWTLVIEVSFYAFLPVYAFAVGRVARGRSVVQRELSALLVIGVVGMLAFAYQSFGAGIAWIDVLPEYLTPFALGMTAAVVQVHGLEVRRPVVRGRTFGVAASWTLATLVWLGLVVVYHRFHADLGDGYQFVRHVAFTTVAGLLVVPVLLWPDGTRIRRFLRSRPMQAIGVVSYGLYLWHVGVMAYIDEHIVHGDQHFAVVPMFAIAAPVSLLLAAASWRFVERPALRLANRLAQRITVRS